MVGSNPAVISLSELNSSHWSRCSIPPHSLLNGADVFFESFCPEEPFNDNSDNSDDSYSRVISGSVKSNWTSYSNRGGHTNDTEQTNTTCRSGIRILKLAAEKGRKRLWKTAWQEPKNRRSRNWNMRSRGVNHRNFNLCAQIQPNFGQLYRFR